jgi:hypothetical protein
VSERDETGSEWAVRQLDDFISAAEPRHIPSPPNVLGPGSYKTSEPDDVVIKKWAVVEQILTRYLADWRERIQPGDGYTRRGYRWREQREAAQLCRAQMQAQADVDRFLKDPGPSLAATSMHPWVWDAAKSAWEAGNFDDALDAAARNISSRLRAKVARRDIGEADLASQVFSDKPADETNQRLRLPLDPSLGAKTETSIYAGIIAFGRGLFQAVRNPLAHEAPGAVQLTEQEALESLASFSLLARWIDRSTVHRS